tara:strand:- start:923 stop:6142 length:5220 start_codon:yes stop_codon:yes gene_type:complete
MKENNITMSDLTDKSWKHNETNEIVTYDPSIDYFERYDLLPKDIYDLIMSVDELEDYQDADMLRDKAEKIGWTFDYYLDNVPYDLRPIGLKSNSFAEGGAIDDSVIDDLVIDEDNNWDNFYEKNPEKVLGGYVQTKTKFGKNVMVLKDNKKGILDKIETPDYRIDIANDFGLSESSEQVTDNTITVEEREVTDANLIQDKKDLINLIQAEDDGTLDDALYTFDEVDETYNVGITDIEKCAFVTYLQGKIGKSVEGGFKKYADKFTRKEMLDKGELMWDFDSFEIQPRFLFLSGNISKKYSTLQNNKSRYIENYGEKAYNIAETMLNEVYADVKSKYLTLDNPIENQRLKILLSSKFAKKTLIEGYNSFSRYSSEVGEREYKSVKEGNVQAQGSFTQYGDLKKIDFGKTDVKYNKRHTFSSLSLAEGFLLWLRDAGDPQTAKSRGVIFRNGMSAQQIIAIYYNQRQKPKDIEKEAWTRTQGYAKENGDRLFSQFLADNLSTEDRRRIEIEWNTSFNSTVTYDTLKVPIGFRFTRFFGEGITNDIRPEKRQAIAYWIMRGSCLFAYGVGIGKTWCSIFTIAQAMELGLTKRPLIVVPKQVYSQFSKEISGILGKQYLVNTLYNLSLNKDKRTKITYLDKGSLIQDKSISICTYDALDNLGFSDGFNQEFYTRISSILAEDNGNLSARQKEKQREKFQSMIGKAKEGGVVEIDSPNTDFDFIAVDEAHNFKKLFTSVKGEANSEQKSEDRVSREKHPYSISGGVQSKMAIKLFFITQYIQSKSKTGNCLLLTATPFTNTPLEIYSMLAFINYDKLRKSGFDSLKSFFDTFADMQTQLTINTQLQPVRKQVFVGFNNVVAMQNIIRDMIDKKSREDEDKLVERPNKIVLPFRNIMKNGINYSVAEKNRISTTLTMSDKQIELSEFLKQYAKGKDLSGGGVSFEDLCLGENTNVTKFGKLKAKLDKLEKAKASDESDNTLNQSKLEEKAPNESAGVRALQCLTYFRQLALNPYLYACSGYKDNPSYTDFVEASPKMLYTFECIKSVIKYEDENGLLRSGQVVYMDFGTDSFPLLVEYAVKVLGYSENEVGFITGTESRIGKKKQKDKSDVQDAFLGRKFDEDTQEYVLVDDKERCKLIFGSSSIREGMNLQFYASTLYNLYIDFNPTDNTQLEGRIWRQGNRFDNVRIVVPLMENSMDIFMFQKLEEKTERINQIWNYDGQTNELNTQDFNPSELKYELITDPLTLAKLEVDDKVKVIDEKIDDNQLQLNSLKNFVSEYAKAKNLNGKFRLGNSSTMEDNIPFQQYMYIQMLRPDLVPLPFLKEKAFENVGMDKLYNQYTRGELNDAVVGGGDLGRKLYSNNIDLGYKSDQERDTYLNYNAKDLIQKIVELHKEKKFSFPPSFTKEEEIKKGDVVFYESKRGQKKAIVDNVNDDDTFDLNIDNSFFDDIPRNKVKLENAKEVKLEPFNPFTKDRTKLYDLIKFQNTSTYEFDRSFYGNPDNFRVVTLLENFNSDFRNYNSLNKSDEIETFQQFRDAGNYGRYVKFWNAEFPLIFKKIETFEKNSLRPLGINSSDELSAKIQEYTDIIADLEVQQGALNDEENLDESANLIKEKLDAERKSGLRKPSTYISRASEFESVNSDYMGNEYLKLLSQKELIKTVDTLTELKKTETYKELSKEDKKIFERKFLSKKKGSKKKTTPKAKEVVSELDKRIKAFKRLLEFKPKDKKLAMRVKALERLREFKQ